MATIKLRETKPIHIRAHLTKGDGSNLLAAEVSTATAKLFDLRSDTPHTALSTTPLTVGTVMDDTNPTAGWNLVGSYNFLWVAPGTDLIQGGGHYRWEIEIDGVSEDDDNWIVVDVQTTELMSV